MRRPLAPDAAHRVRPRRGSSATGGSAAGLREIAAVHRGDFRLTPNQNLIDRERRRRRSAGASTRWSSATASTRTRRRRRCGATRSPASRCRPARWRWPRPSATCRRLRSAIDDLLHKYAVGDAAAVVPDHAAARTAARGRTSPRSRWSARRRAATTCTSAATRDGQRLNGSTARTSTSRILAALDAAVRALAAREREAGERFGDFAWRAGGSGRARPCEELHDAPPRRTALRTEPARSRRAEQPSSARCAPRSACVGARNLPGQHALSSSFGAQAAVSLHLVTRAGAAASR